MIHNDAVIATGIPTSNGLTVSQVSMPGEAIAFEDAGRPRRFQRRARMAGRDVSYPLPGYGIADAGLMQPGIITAADPAGLPPMAASPTILPEVATQPSLAPPAVASTPTLIPQADPAHATEIAAGLPVVDPH
jgi:hypothetical protein